MNNLRYWRKMRNLTQLDLAHQVGVSRTSIHNAETGRLSLNLAERCAAVLSVNKYLLLGTDAIIGAPSNKDMVFTLNELCISFKGQHVFYKTHFGIREGVIDQLTSKDIIVHDFKEDRGDVYTARIYSFALEMQNIFWAFNKEDLEG